MTAERSAIALWARLLVDSGDLSPTSRLLDVGGGSGCLAAAIHAVSGSACTVADPRPPAGKPRGVTFVAASADNLPLADATFDAALFSHALHHLPRAESALREAARVTVSGGRLLIRAATHADLRALPHAAWMPSLLAGILASVPDAPTIVEWLARAGWRDIIARTIRTPSEMGMDEYAGSVALLAFRDWALARAGGPDPRDAADAWARATFPTPPPTPETLITAVKPTERSM